MKCFAVFTALTFLCVIVDFADANSGLIKMFAKTCKKSEGASDKDVDDLSSGTAPETPEGKCLAGMFELKI
jgi:PBP/GOBP family